MALLGLTSGSAMYFHSYQYGGVLATVSLILVLAVMVV
jgi:hypothetical protein